MIDGILDDIAIVQHYALIDLGVNGIAALQEASTKTHYQEIIDAIHTKWPDCKIYLTKPWMRDADVYADNLAGWIDDLITDNSGYCYVADDERGWLKGSDNGVTMTIDGVHYNAVGYAEKINQMVTVFGY